MDDEQLIRRICDAALLRGTFTLRSGRTSHYYLDKYLFETDPVILGELAKRLAERVPAQADRVAGAELGGVPLATATSLAVNKPAVFIRNQKKEYGTARQLEGRLGPGESVVLLEDVATTGGQVLEAADVLRAAGAEVLKVVAVLDREQGASQNIEGAGLVFEALFSKSDLGLHE